MNTECDYSSAYISIFTDREFPLVGHGMTFTIGRGNEIVIWTAYFV
jgi:L-fuconate dehydratase